MKVVILAGGRGTRISEESYLKPKPMIEIGGKPMLWHIMKLYSHYGFNEFIVCAGYKQYAIKEYFADYFLHNSDITFDFTNSRKEIAVHSNKVEPWKVTIVDTGLDTLTGGRIKRIKDYLDGDEFLLTYGDGVSDVDITRLIDFHHNSGRLVTLTGVQPEGRFGILDIASEGAIQSFREKNRDDVGWINAGFMVCSKKAIDYIQGDDTTWEKEPLERIAQEGQLVCYRHPGFWQCMDTMRDKDRLETLWQSGKAPWKLW